MKNRDRKRSRGLRQKILRLEKRVKELENENAYLRTQAGLSPFQEDLSMFQVSLVEDPLPGFELSVPRNVEITCQEPKSTHTMFTTESCGVEPMIRPPGKKEEEDDGKR
jgi:hypothetical protein